jgi:hypothetical protein
MAESQAAHDPDPSARFRLTADDLLGDLLWPKLFRVPRLALRPGRIGLAVAGLLVVMLVDSLLASAAGGPEVLPLLLGGLTPVVPASGSWFSALADTVLGAVSTAWDTAPLRTAIVLPLTVVCYGVVGAAVGRMAAEEFCRGHLPPWTHGLTWSLRAFWGLVIVHALPLAVVAFIVGTMSVGGLAVLSLPGVNVLGAVLGVAVLALSFVCVVLLVAYLLGLGMFAPAIAVEGPDGIDAMQRVYAYIIGRPGRLAAYSLVLGAQFAVVFALAMGLAALTAELAVWSMSLLLSADAARVASGVGGEQLGGMGKAAARVMATVLQLPMLLAAGYGVAYWICGGTVQYLLLRRATDGQDVSDLHDPEALARRVDEIMAKRAATATDRPA